MSLFSPIKLYCVICGISFYINSTPGYMYFKAFGYCCSENCWNTANDKYAKMILGKEDIE